MNWLFWKDWRVNRLIVIVALFLFVVPHAAALYAACRGFGPPRLPFGAPRLAADLAISSLYSLLLSQVGIALLGGNAFAGERADRSAEFLGYLPVSRRRILTSKMLAAISIIGLIWVPNLLILGISVSVLAPDIPVGGPSGDLTGVLANAAITGLAFFCVAWLFSTFLESPAIAAAAGLIAPFLIAGGIYFVLYLRDFPPGVVVAMWYGGLCLVLSFVSFVAGTWHYLRRLDP